jgi:RNA polymerase sigma-70 factor, ECF subfamily
MDYDKLIVETSEGNTASLEKLYRDLSSVVFALALSILKNRSLAEDVLQDTFVRIKISAGSYKPGTNGRAWILKIARNLAISALRSSHHETSGTFIEVSEASGIDFAQDKIDSLILRESLSILSQQERQILLLHAVKDLKHREIAQVLDIPLGTALWKYRQAIRKMEKFLKSEEINNI